MKVSESTVTCVLVVPVAMLRTLPPVIVDLADVTALLANISVSTIPSGRPPTETPVTVPLPLIVIGIIYTIVHVSPAPTVTVTESFIVTGPKVPAFLLLVIV